MKVRVSMVARAGFVCPDTAAISAMLTLVDTSVAASVSTVFDEMAGLSSSSHQSGSIVMVYGVANATTSLENGTTFFPTPFCWQRRRGFYTPQRTQRWRCGPSMMRRRDGRS